MCFYCQDGHILQDKEVVALLSILDGGVIAGLRKEGIDLHGTLRIAQLKKELGGDVHGPLILDQLKKEGVDFHRALNISFEQVQDILTKLGKEEADLKEVLDLGMRLYDLHAFLIWDLYICTAVKRNEFLEDALRTEIKLPLKCLKFLFLGAPRAGKTTFLKRLVGKIKELNKDRENPSTNVVECTDALICIAATITDKTEWCCVESDSKKDGLRALDKEALMIYHFVEKTRKQQKWKAQQELKAKEESEAQYKLKAQQERLQASQHQHIDEQQLSKPDEHVKPGGETKSVEETVSKSIERDNSWQPEYQQVQQKDNVETLTTIEHSVLDAEVDDMFKSWEKVLSEHNVSEIKEISKGTVLVNMIDIGGQPCFLEMSSVLTLGPALYLVFFDLRQEIKERIPVTYVLEELQSLRKIELPYWYSVQEVVFKIFSSVACFNHSHDQNEYLVPIQSQVVSLVGTHLDKAINNEHTHREKQMCHELENLEADDFYRSQPYQRYLHKLDGKNYILAVNNDGGDDEIKEHKEQLEDLIENKFKKFDIPVSWLLFSIFLRRMERPVITLDQCKMIAQRLYIKEVEYVLWYLHHHTGVVMYYSHSEISELGNIIICDPAIIFDCISNLVISVFKKKEKELWKTGIFTCDDLEEAQVMDEVNHFTRNHLISLLKYLNVLVELDESKYFMHAVLIETDDLPKENEKIASLIIRFDCGFVPNGCFSQLIIELIKSRKFTLELKKSKEFELELVRDEIRKNRVKFNLQSSYLVTLVSRPKYYEVHVDANVEESNCALNSWEACHVIKTVVCRALDSVIETLKKKYMYISCDKLTRYHVGFICCRDECQQLKLENHVMIIDNDCHNISLKQNCKCLQSRVTKSYHLTLKKHLVWSDEVNMHLCTLSSFIYTLYYLHVLLLLLIHLLSYKNVSFCSPQKIRL